MIRIKTCVVHPPIFSSPKMSTTSPASSQSFWWKNGKPLDSWRRERGEICAKGKYTVCRGGENQRRKRWKIFGPGKFFLWRIRTRWKYLGALRFPWNFNFSKPWKCQKLSVLPHKLVAVMSTHQPCRPLLSYQPGKHWKHSLASAYKSYVGSLCTRRGKCTCDFFVHSLSWLNPWLWCSWTPTLPMC